MSSARPHRWCHRDWNQIVWKNALPHSLARSFFWVCRKSQPMGVKQDIYLGCCQSRGGGGQQIQICRWLLFLSGWVPSVTSYRLKTVVTFLGVVLVYVHKKLTNFNESTCSCSKSFFRFHAWRGGQPTGTKFILGIHSNGSNCHPEDMLWMTPCLWCAWIKDKYITYMYTVYAYFGSCPNSVTVDHEGKFLWPQPKSDEYFPTVSRGSGRTLLVNKYKRYTCIDKLRSNTNG